MNQPISVPLKALALVGIATMLAACAQSPSMYEYEPTLATAAPGTMADVAGEKYAHIEENKRKSVANEPVSTFSIDVDTASYANVRRFITGGHLPPEDAVRIEEMINYFDYSYEAPQDKTIPFKVTTELGPTPWNSGSYLLHIGIKGYQPVQAAQPARNLVFLIDVSGSMQDENKLGLLKKSLRLLVKQLRSQDRVAMVVYAGSSGLVLPSTSGDQHNKIISAVEWLQAGGSTNGGAGIELAYAVAQEHFVKNGVNRVILATDGDFNVGPSSTEDLLDLIKQKKSSGVGLTVLGFGMGNYNDEMLEAVSNAGDGNAAYIDNLKEAQKVLVTDMGATLNTIAKDTKIQVEFNPQQVSSYRLIGYENRMLSREDFKNDRIDAGEVGAGHTVTALYEITLNDGLRYQEDSAKGSKFNDELGFLKIRYKRPDESISREMVHAVKKEDIHEKLLKTSDNFRFSAAVAAFGQQLRHSKYIEGYKYNELFDLASGSRGTDRYGYRSEFLQLVQLAESLN